MRIEASDMDLRFRPLGEWPGHRTLSRRASQFRATYSKTLDLLQRELFYLRARDVVVEAEFQFDQIRIDGWPYANSKPAGPGVILSFTGKSGPLRFPCDRYLGWQDNLRAIALSLESLRAVDRYGVTRHAEQYRGWAQIEPPKLGQDAAIATLARHAGLTETNTRSDYRAAYRAAARATHPDSGGKHDDFVAVTAAFEFLNREVKSQ